MYFKICINFLKEFFKRIDYSGKFNVIDISKYLIHLSVEKNKYLSINQLNGLLYFIQRFYLDKRNFALFKNDFISNKGHWEIQEVNEYFCGFGAMNLFYKYFDLTNDCKIPEEYRVELESLFDSYIDRIKSRENCFL